MTAKQLDYRRLALAIGRWAVTVAVAALLAFLAFVAREQDRTISALRAENARDQEIQGQLRAQADDIRDQVLADCESHRDWVELPAAAATAAAARTPGATPTVNPFVAQLAGSEAAAYARKGCARLLGTLPPVPTPAPPPPPG